MGVNQAEVLGDIPKFFLISLKGRLPPGRVSFTKLSKGANFMAFASCSERLPDVKRHEESTFVASVPIIAHGFDIKASKIGREMFFDN